jgi:aminopeptidase
MAYTPSQGILDKYAKVLVNFALNKGKGIKKGDVVRIIGEDASKPLFAAVYRQVIKSGGHVISSYSPSVAPGFNLGKDFFELAKSHQINFFAEKYMRGLIDQVDHMIAIDCETDMKAMEGIDSKKIMARGLAQKPAHLWRNKKEQAGKFSWTIGLYGTPAMAKEAGMSEKAYWEQIIKACFLDEKDPIAHWKKVVEGIQRDIKKLNALKIKKVHITGEDADLHITIGEDRQWLGGRGANIPSFEIFTSPDWRGTNGWIKFNQPLYRYGNLIKGIRLEFKDGLVTKATATDNQKVLRDMIATPDANKIGEFSMTDKRFSRITKFMATTLYDENIGGPNGNSHIAVGMAYADTFSGDPAKLTEARKKALGFNDSTVHTDMITTTPRTVTAILANGKEKVIYKDGKFTI